MKIEAKTIMVVGDPHGEIGKVNEFINKKRPDVLIVVGDFALHWWVGTPSSYNTAGHWVLDDEGFKNLKPGNTRVFWLMGNHQAWDCVEKLWGRSGAEPIEIKPNVFYCPIGSILAINNMNCLFVGGALSIDKDARTPGYTWFEQEVLTTDDLEYICSAVTDDIHIMFSHTCPWEFDIQDKWDYKTRINDPTRLILSKIRNKYKPLYSFFGHWHRQKGGMYKETQWQCLNTMSQGCGDQGKYVADISELFEADDEK